MSRQHLQPPELFESRRLGFTQVVTSPPGKLVFVSGQVAWDREMKLIGDSDLGAQTEQALENLRSALHAADASPADVTMCRAYVVDYQPEYAAQIGPYFDRFFAGAAPPASTWIGVQSLAAPGLLIEIEAMAVV